MRCRGMVCLLGFVWVILLSVSRMAEAQWVQTSGPEECKVRLVAADGPRVFAVVGRLGLYVSEDLGARWTAVRSVPPISDRISCLAAFGGRVFVGWNSGDACFSPDNGSHWNKVPLAKVKEVNNVTAFVMSGKDLYIGREDGLYVCRDLENAPTPHPVMFPEPMSVVGLAVLGADLFVGGRDGIVYRVRLNAGSGPVFTKFRLPGKPRFMCFTESAFGLLAGTDEGIFRPSGDSLSWTKADVRLPKNAEVSFLGAVGHDVLVAFDYPWGSQGPGAARLSTADGIAWSVAFPVIERSAVISFAASGAEMFAGTSDGVYRSSDGGVSWTRASTGLPVASSVESLAAIGSRIFAGTMHGLWRAEHGNVHMSEDEGRTWIPVGTGLPDHSAAARLAVRGQDIVAGLGSVRNFEKGPGIYLSRDLGRTWTAVNSGLNQDTTICDLAVLGPDVFALTAKSVFVMKDLGDHWSPRNEGLPRLSRSLLVAGGDELFLCVLNYRGPTLGPASLLSFLTGAGSLYAGAPPPDSLLYYWPKNGTKWQFTHIKFQGPITCMAKIGEELFVGTMAGLYVTVNYAMRELPRHLDRSPHRPAVCLTVDGGNLAMSDGRGVYLLRKVDSQWREVDTGFILKGTEVQSLLATESGLYAGTDNRGVWYLPRADLERLLR